MRVPLAVFGVCMKLFPRAFRERFEPEMREIFETELARCSTRRQAWSLVIRSTSDMVVSAIGARKDSLKAPVPQPAAHPSITVEKPPSRSLKPLTADQLTVSRRQFLNRAWGLSFFGLLGFFGMSSLSFLWPKLTGGFGTKIVVGDYETLLAKVGPEAGYAPLFVPEGRFYLTFYEGTADSPVYAAIGVQDTQLLALYRKCVHLGCSVPFCASSKLFECPCHGSKYRLNGEYHEGPAPRGLDRFPVAIDDKGSVIVDTGAVQVGPPRGTNTWDAFAGPKGPLCVPRP
jgi:cytochrome b6-f complex iron-sulfur subunit